MIYATVPGRRYEMEVFADGRIEVEAFGVDGHIRGRHGVDDLLATSPDGPSSTA
jgi:hypothetical protein